MHSLTGIVVGAMMWGGADAGVSSTVIEPEIIETRTIRLTQTVTLHDVDQSASDVLLWIPVPVDGPWQRVLDLSVDEAPGDWRLEPLADGRGMVVYAEVPDAGGTSPQVVISATVERHGVSFPIASVPDGMARLVQGELFGKYRRADAPLMEVDEDVAALAERLCGSTTDPAQEAMLLLQGVAEIADHYSKNPNVPTCGRGAASDCLEHGGGCCTDLHSLFIALARARDIPARLQFGYRVLDPNEGKQVDPGYRCWVEFFLPGAGWVPTDIVAADGSDEALPHRWCSLSSTRIGLWEGRSFQLSPPAEAGRIDTMLTGWAEIDGKAVDPLPADDGTPAQLRRTVKYEVLKTTRTADTPQLPQ